VSDCAWKERNSAVWGSIPSLAPALAYQMETVVNVRDLSGIIIL
jgi:hypothetical protein